jgi:hypothetical protein
MRCPGTATARIGDAAHPDPAGIKPQRMRSPAPQIEPIDHHGGAPATPPANRYGADHDRRPSAVLAKGRGVQHERDRLSVRLVNAAKGIAAETTIRAQPLARPRRRMRQPGTAQPRLTLEF